MDDLPTYLRARRAERHNLFTVDVPSPREIHIVFGPSRLLFDLELKLWFSEGAWRGRGTLETNTSRLYGAIGAFQDFAREIFVPDGSLLRPVNFERNPFGTLDGKDNVVPADLLPRAMRTDWCALTGSYLEAVVQLVNATLGDAIDFDTGSQLQPLIRLPPPDRWTLKEAEVYSECRDENAPMRVAELAEIARSMSSEYALSSYGDHGVPIEERTANMPSLRVRLGAEGVHLSAYAKTFDRMRFEVRYTKHPMSVCDLAVSHYTGQANGAVEALRGVRSNALRRLRRFLSGYQQHRSERRPTLSQLTIALSVAAHAAPRTPPTLYRVLSLLMLHGGLSRSAASADIQLVIDHLVEADVLRPARMTPRGQHDYVLGPTYAAAFRRIRDLSLY